MNQTRILELKLEHVTLEAAHALTEDEYGGCTDPAEMWLLEQRLQALEHRMRRLRLYTAVAESKAARS